MSTSHRPVQTGSAVAGYIVPVVTAEHVAAVAELAHAIWYEHYVPVIGRAQVDYMVAHLQSIAAISEQISQGLRYCLLDDGANRIGYFAYRIEPAERTVFISKLYVHARYRGQGWARSALGYMEREARMQGADRIWLTVNKYNPALVAYERLGFMRTNPVVTDIGGGYVMDDYRMEKSLSQ